MWMIGRVVVMGLVAVKFQSRLRKDARIKAVSRWSSSRCHGFPRPAVRLPGSTIHAVYVVRSLGDQNTAYVHGFGWPRQSPCLTCLSLMNLGTRTLRRGPGPQFMAQNSFFSPWTCPRESLAIPRAKVTHGVRPLAAYIPWSALRIHYITWSRWHSSVPLPIFVHEVPHTVQLLEPADNAAELLDAKILCGEIYDSQQKPLYNVWLHNF